VNDPSTDEMRRIEVEATMLGLSVRAEELTLVARDLKRVVLSRVTMLVPVLVTLVAVLIVLNIGQMILLGVR
jgi:hypothetical protein